MQLDHDDDTIPPSYDDPNRAAGVVDEKICC